MRLERTQCGSRSRCRLRSPVLLVGFRAYLTAEVSLFGVARAATEWNGVLVRNVGRRDRRAVQGNACASSVYDV